MTLHGGIWLKSLLYPFSYTGNDIVEMLEVLRISLKLILTSSLENVKRWLE